MPRWAITLLIFLIALVGWAGLAYLVFNYVPDPWTVGLAVCLVFVAVAGTVMPPVHFLNYRFSQQAESGDGSPSDGWTVYRQSGMVGLLAALCCWFQVMRVLNWIIVILLVGVIVLIEVFFRSRAD
jgi:hypothetical protein